MDRRLCRDDGGCLLRSHGRAVSPLNGGRGSTRVTAECVFRSLPSTNSCSGPFCMALGPPSTAFTVYLSNSLSTEGNIVTKRGSCFFSLLIYIASSTEMAFRLASSIFALFSFYYKKIVPSYGCQGEVEGREFFMTISIPALFTPKHLSALDGLAHGGNLPSSVRSRIKPRWQKRVVVYFILFLFSVHHLSSGNLNQGGPSAWHFRNVSSPKGDWNDLLHLFFFFSRTNLVAEGRAKGKRKSNRAKVERERIFRHF